MIDDVLNDPRWEELTRLQKAQARERLFEAYVAEDPVRRDFFVESDEAERSRVFAGFVDRLQQKYRDKFTTPIEQPAPPPRRERFDETQAMYDMASGGATAVAEPPPEPIHVPILDVAAERKLAAIEEAGRTKKGSGFEDWALEDFERLGPVVDALHPGASDGGRVAAREQVTREGKKLGRTEPESTGMGIARQVITGAARPVVDAVAALDRASPGTPEEQERLALGNRLNAVNDWVINADGGFEAAGAVGSLVAGGVGAARAIASGKGAGHLVTKKGLAKLAAADAGLGALYAESAPGFLAHAVDRWTGEHDAVRSKILTGLEAAGISGLAGLGMRSWTTARMKSWARENLGFTGRSMDDLKRHVDDLAAARARPADAGAPPGEAAAAQRLPQEAATAEETFVQRAAAAPESVVDDTVSFDRGPEGFPAKRNQPTQGGSGEEISISSKEEEGSGQVGGESPGPAGALKPGGESIHYSQEADVGDAGAPEGPKGDVDGATWGDGVAVPFAQLDRVRAAEMPELVAMARELSGAVPEIRKLKKAQGLMRGRGRGEIVLDQRLFTNPTQAARVMAHELMHLVDYLPEQTLKRGNVLGRLGVLRDYLRTTLDMVPADPSRALQQADRAKVRKEAFAATKEAMGARPLQPDDGPGHKAWNEAWNENYRKAIDAEIDTRKLGTNERVREELVALSDWWKPFLDQAAGGNLPASYVAYRESAVELYADFGSVLFNDPVAARDRAPNAWKMFWNYIDRKPEVKQALFEVQELLAGGGDAVMARRRAARLQGFKRGDEVFIRKVEERAAGQRSFRGFQNRIHQHHVDRFGPIERKAYKLGQRGNEQARALAWLFDEYPLKRKGMNLVLMQDVYDRVIKPVHDAGLTMESLGEVAMLQRIKNETWGDSQGRAKLANPGGESPDTAAAGLDGLRRMYGEKDWGVIQQALAEFQEIQWAIISEAVDLGVYSREWFETVAKPNRGNYVTFAVVDYLQDFIPAAVKKQQGTLNDIANPLLASMLKLASINRLNLQQRVSLRLAEFMGAEMPGEIKPAEVRQTQHGQEPMRNPDPAGGLLRVLDDGKRAGFWVPNDVALMFEDLPPGFLDPALDALVFGFRRLFYPLIITYNTGFLLAVSPIRDSFRAFRNVPKGAGARVFGEWVANLAGLALEAVNVPLSKARLPPIPVPTTRAGTAARNYLRGKADPLVREMLVEGAISTPMDSFVSGPKKDVPFAELMRKYGALPATDKPWFARANFMQPVFKLLKAIEYGGLVLEMTPKMSVYKYALDHMDLDKREASGLARNQVGVPNIHRKGLSTRTPAALFPFFNVATQGYRDDFRRATGKGSRTGWWLRWAMGTGLRRMLQAAGAAGLLGAKIKEMYDYVSEYDKTNYGVIPVGWVDGGDFGKKVLYLRVPEDETDRLLAGIMHKAVQGLAGDKRVQWGELLGYAGGQIPGWNPVVEVPKAWGQYVAGSNPKDNFRNASILSNSEWLAANADEDPNSWPATKSMIEWTYGKTGLQNFVRYDREAETLTEVTVSAIPGVNRLYKVSDYGAREQQDALEQAEDAKRAKVRVAQTEQVQNIYGEYQFLRTIKQENRTPAQMERWYQLSAWYSQVYKPYEALMLFEREEGRAISTYKRQLDEASTAFQRR